MHKIHADFDKMIQSHSRWKFHLKDVIEHGKSDLVIADVRNSHLCLFGQWLDSAEGRKLPYYKELVELHREFHNEAANILQMAVNAQKEMALEKMKLGSRFNQIAAKLIDKIADIKRDNVIKSK